MVTPSASDGDGGKLTRRIHYVNISSFISLRDRDDDGRGPSPATSSQRLYGVEVDLDTESRTGRERETVRPDRDGLGEGMREGTSVVATWYSKAMKSSMSRQWCLGRWVDAPRPRPDRGMSGRSPRLARLLAMAFIGETDVAAIHSPVRRLLNENEFAGRAELLAQVDAIEYADGPVTMMRLRVPPTYPPARGVPSPVPNSPTVLDEGREPIGVLLHWLDDAGYIDCLEYGWVTDKMPTRLPTPDRIADS
jgi:hypothetical protein